jgi:hypothetical protein
MTWSKRNVRSLVQRYLEGHQPRRYKLAATEAVRDGDYWYVLVQPDKLDVRAFDYNERLADTEEDIRDHEKDAPNLLLVPVLPADPYDR